ncbi:MAG: DUF3109 family protein [Bacteroidota bacterium]|nr:DUF3109 family protein [Bacteroidota bacterium]
MIEIDDKIISDDILEEQFVCDLSQCKGACCVEGDAGAPLEKEEINILEEIYPVVKSEMRQQGIDAVEKEGLYYLDDFGEPVTTLVNNKECAFVVFDKNNIAKCAIEISSRKNKTDFIKPISCHLYPIRVKEYEGFQGINLHKWHICEPACECGKDLKIPVFKFLKEPIIRKWGVEFFNQLNHVFEQFFR